MGCIAAACLACMNNNQQSKDTNALLAAVVASSMDAVFSMDVNGRIQTWNAAAERLYGYTAVEAIGQWLRFLAPDPTNYVPGPLFRRAIGGEQIYFEAMRRRKDGRLVEVGISSGPIRDAHGNVVGISVVHRDISERSRAERELRQAHQLLEMAQEAGGVASWEYEPASGEVRWSSELYRQLKYDAAGITPSLSAFSDRASPEDREQLDRIYEQEKTADAGTQFQMEVRVIQPDGSVCWFDRRSQVVLHEDRLRVIGVNVDITERKKQEENLRFVMGELSHRTKNVLSVVQAIAAQTARYTESFGDFQERLLGRIQALSQSHDLLVSQDWRGAPLKDLIFAQLGPFLVDPSRVQTEGPPIFLKAEATQALGMILHELATNASKYGALSVPTGHIRIHWDISRSSVQLTWCELNGPVVKGPTRLGFGRTMIERIATEMFGPTSKLELLSTGVRWSALVPFSLLAASPPSDALYPV
jgi:PAS domain S-box-containing protein